MALPSGAETSPTRCAYGPAACCSAPHAFADPGTLERLRIKVVHGHGWSLGAWDGANFSPSDGLLTLGREMGELRPRLPIMDTLNRCLAGISENETRDGKPDPKKQAETDSFRSKLADAIAGVRQGEVPPIIMPPPGIKGAADLNQFEQQPDPTSTQDAPWRRRWRTR